MKKTDIVQCVAPRPAAGLPAETIDERYVRCMVAAAMHRNWLNCDTSAYRNLHNDPCAAECFAELLWGLPLPTISKRRQRIASSINLLTARRRLGLRAWCIIVIVTRSAQVHGFTRQHHQTWHGLLNVYWHPFTEKV